MKNRIQIYLVLMFGMILIPTQAYDRIDVFSGNGESNNEANELICTDGTIDFAPTVTLQPSAQAICVSGDATFTIEATGNGTVTYQWQYWVNPTTYASLSEAGVYSGTQTSTLTITGADNTLAELAETDNSDGIVSAYYRCVVSDVDGSTNSGLTYLHIHTTPTVTSDPTDVAVCDSGTGITTSFGISSSINPGGLSFQWMVDDGSGYIEVTDGGVYSNATTKTLQLTGATSTLSGNTYKCIVGNCASAVESTAALLTIDDKPVISLQPVQPMRVCEGEDVTYTVEATGNSLTYQWQEAPAGSGIYTDIANNGTYSAIGNTLTVYGVTLGMYNYRYRCVVTSGLCTQNSTASALYVYGLQTLSPATPTNNLTVCEGGSTTFVVGRSGSSVPFNNGTMAYQWQSDNGIDVYTDITDDAIYSGTTSNQLTISDATLSFDGMKYRCVIRGCGADIPSTPETLTVNQLPLVTTSPQSQTVCVGDEVTFTAAATGTDVTYLWQVSMDGGTNYSTAPYSGSRTSTLTIHGSQTQASINGYIFKCIASSATPCTTTSESNPATLTINEVTITAHPVNVTTCMGDDASFSVTAQGNNLTYQWYINNDAITDGGIYSGTTSNTLVLTGVGLDLNGALYYCVVSGNCLDASSSYSKLYVYGVEKPQIVADFSNPTQPYLYSNAIGNTYEWFLNGSFYTSGGANLSVSEAGSYTVIVTLNNCPSEESDAIVIIVTDLGKELLNNMVTYPNPVLDKLIIRLDQVIDNTFIRLVDLNGKMKINQAANGMNNEVDFSGLAKGTYLVQIVNAEKTLTYKVIKE